MFKRKTFTIEEREERKSRKRSHLMQLAQASAMTLVIALALTTVTYAWFENTAAAAVRPLDVTVGTSMKLQIAASETGEYKYKLEMADISQFFDKLKNNGSGPGILDAVSSANCSSFFMTTGASDDKGFNAFKTVKAEDGYYLELPVYLKGTADMDVYLSGDTMVRMEAPSSSNAQYMDRAIRVGFKTADGNVIFEPNEATDMPGRHGNTAGAKKGEAVSGISGTTPTFQNQNAKGKGALYVTFNGAEGEMADSNNTDITGKEKLATLKANEAKQFGIYLWLEGTDEDCVNGMGDGTLLVDLKFIGVLN